MNNSKPITKTKSTVPMVTEHARVIFLAQAAVIAALYIVLTMAAATLNLASGAIQVRFSEALTILPFFTPAAIPGVTIGCLLANILTGCALPDIIFGTLATLLGALGTYALRHHRVLASLPPVVSNAIIVPLLLRYAYGTPGALWFFALTVGAGEAISVCLLGEALLSALYPFRNRIFAAPER